MPNVIKRFTEKTVRVLSYLIGIVCTCAKIQEKSVTVEQSDEKSSCRFETHENLYECNIESTLIYFEKRSI